MKFQKSLPGIFLLTLSFIFTTNGLAQATSSKNEIYSLLFTASYDSAIQLLESEIKQDSTSSECYFLLGSALSGLNKSSQAIENFKTAYQLDPENYDNLIAYGNCQARIGQFGAAEKLFLKALTLDSIRQTARINLAKAQLRQRKYQDAFDNFRKLSWQDSSNSYYLSQSAYCAERLKNKELAIDLYLKAYQVDSLNLEILSDLAKILYRANELDSSLVYTDKGIAIVPDEPEFHKLKGDIYYKKKIYTAAVLSYLKVLAEGDSTIDVLKKLGFCYYNGEKYKEACEVLSEAYNLNNSDPLISFYLGICFKQLEDYENAVFSLNIALKVIIPDYMDLLFAQLGDSYHNLKKYKDAIWAYKKAMEYAPRNPLYNYYLANVYYDYYADKNIAAKYYKKILEIDDLNPDILEHTKARLNEIAEWNHFTKKKK